MTKSKLDKEKAPCLHILSNMDVDDCYDFDLIFGDALMIGVHMGSASFSQTDMLPERTRCGDKALL